MTLSTCEWTGPDGLSLNCDSVCSLSDILEIGDVPRRYFLTPQVCMAILRRVGDQGRVLPSNCDMRWSECRECGCKQLTTHAAGLSFRGRDGGSVPEIIDGVSHALRASQGGGDKPYVLIGDVIRRLTPRECERLQGFPDDYTLIRWRGKEVPDGPRYKALGNSMAVNVMRWLGRRIQSVSLLNG